MSLYDIQTAVRAPKGLKNDFGGYAYRNAEQIIAAVKRVLPDGAHLILSDDMVMVGDTPFLKATARLVLGDKEHIATGWAMHAISKKGMDPAQITGAASSYARKYALQGLLALDDSKEERKVDPDDCGPYEPGPDPLLEEIRQASTPHDLNRLLPRVKTASRDVKQAMVKRAAELGFMRNPDGPGYIAPPQKPEPVPEPIEEDEIPF
jgi:hypothetical protein